MIEVSGTQLGTYSDSTYNIGTYAGFGDSRQADRPRSVVGKVAIYEEVFRESSSLNARTGSGSMDRAPARRHIHANEGESLQAPLSGRIDRRERRRMMEQ
jgi:hypothetical protein